MCIRDSSVLFPVNIGRMRFHNSFIARRWWGTVMCSKGTSLGTAKKHTMLENLGAKQKSFFFPREETKGWENGGMWKCSWKVAFVSNFHLLIDAGRWSYTNRTSCMALHFAGFNHSRFCLLHVVISFWSVNWMETDHSHWKVCNE